MLVERPPPSGRGRRGAAAHAGRQPVGRAAAAVRRPRPADIKDVPVYHRARPARRAARVPGPAIIAEDETTTIVPTSFAARIDRDRRIILLENA